jgi:hypothetical protein
VSLLSRERLLIGFAPSGVALLRLRGLLRPRVVARHRAACETPGQAEPWRGASATLRAALDGLQGGAPPATVVLSNHFVRYALLPWSGALSRADEEQAYARHHFLRIYGERAKRWTLRVGAAPQGALRLAAAIDDGLLQSLAGNFSSPRGPRLVSVQPYLMSACNHWSRRFPAQGAWLMLLEPGRACLALWAAGQWRALRCARGNFAAPTALADLLERERAQLGGAVPEIVLLQGGRGTVEPPRASGWRFEVLPLVEDYLGSALAAA